MEKKRLIVFLFVVFILSISLVSAGFFQDFWGKITGKVVSENETEEEIIEPKPEPEPCRPISGWRIEDNKCIEDYGCDYDESKYTYYGKEECENMLEVPPEPPVMECYDSDEGKNYYKKGSHSMCDSEGGCSFPSPCDYCLDDTTLNECYCEGQEIRSEKYVCHEGCENGACISEQCPTIIGWRIKENYCVSDSGCEYDSSRYTYYNSEEDCREQLTETPVSSMCEEVEDINRKEDCYVMVAERTRDSSLCEKITDISRKQKCYVLSQEQPPEPEPRPDPTRCAAEIRITFNKDVYYVGDDFKVVIEVLDSQGSYIPYHHFYSQTYTYEPEGMWHTASLAKTDEKGYFIFKGIVEEGKSAFGKTKHKIYIEASNNCPYVEKTAEVEVRRKETETVKCAMGECIPIKDKEEKKPVNIPTEKVFYSCTGCEVEGKCYPIGYRKEGEYCCIDNKFIPQIDDGKCDNSFECKSNLCLNGECMTEGFIERVIELLKKMMGIEPKPPVLKECSKLLVERDIGDNEYEKSEYGVEKGAQVPVYSENGENIRTIRCCMAHYSTGAVIVCPFNSKEETQNSLKWILARGDAGSYSIEEHKGEKIIDISDGQIIAWTNDAYLIASGGTPETGRFVEEIGDVYFKKYPSDFALTQDDIPHVEPPKISVQKRLVFCTPEDEEKANRCEKSGGDAQMDNYPEKECWKYTYCITAEEKCGSIDNTDARDECYRNVAVEAEDTSLCEKITGAHMKEKCYILVED
ncbi:hypothetical protein KY345_05075 [Candidatus Woesearchaeota archaeon]|nr:hypothetical protein [Candidatus Woesearchaeota archaeon]